MLSGTGSDGSEGVKAVKNKGGFVIVQEPSEAAFDGMPKSAIQTGQADCILPVAEMPAGAYRTHERTSPRRCGMRTRVQRGGYLGNSWSCPNEDRTGFLPLQDRHFNASDRTAHGDGGHNRDRALHREAQSEPSELDSLAHDLLINVTEFFRDAAAFQALAETVIPEMVAAQPPDRPLRVWAPGCSTGEEAYSLAILFLEAIAASKRAIKLQVFASDLDPHAIAFARVGVYGREANRR